MLLELLSELVRVDTNEGVLARIEGIAAPEDFGRYFDLFRRMTAISAVDQVLEQCRIEPGPAEHTTGEQPVRFLPDRIPFGLPRHACKPTINS